MTGRLRARLAAEGLLVEHQVALSHGPGCVFRLHLAGGRRVKMRVFPRSEKAAHVWRLLQTRPPVLPRPLLLAGRTLVVEYIEGVSLDRRLPGITPESRSRLVRLTGRLLARLHGGPRPRVSGPALVASTWLLTRVVNKLRRRRLLDEPSARRLTGLGAPSRARVALSHGDPAPDNLVLTPSGGLRAIDEERLTMRPVGFDLARAVARWPLGPDLETELLTGYAEAGGDAGAYLAHRPFWIATALATSAAFRLVYRPEEVVEIAGQLRALTETLD